LHLCGTTSRLDFGDALIIVQMQQCGEQTVYAHGTNCDGIPGVTQREPYCVVAAHWLKHNEKGGPLRTRLYRWCVRALDAGTLAGHHMQNRQQDARANEGHDDRADDSIVLAAQHRIYDETAD